MRSFAPSRLARQRSHHHHPRHPCERCRLAALAKRHRRRCRHFAWPRAWAATCRQQTDGTSRCFSKCSFPALDDETSAPPPPAARWRTMNPRSLASSQTGNRGHEVATPRAFRRKDGDPGRSTREDQGAGCPRSRSQRTRFSHKPLRRTSPRQRIRILPKQAPLSRQAGRARPSLASFDRTHNYSWALLGRGSPR